jgi:DNA-binding NtrC family response regulator
LSEPTIQPVSSTSAAKPARVLVIDDEGVVCLSCQRILSGVGYSVESYQDPRKGLEEALTDRFDVILLDIVMPEMGGLEVLRRIKDSAVSSEVVMISGYSTVESAVQAMKLGAVDYVSKPFTPDELRVVMQKVMERSALIARIWLCASSWKSASDSRA